ncbi:hypothetical protein HYFRA_00003305 [Hymenoscyphus fraxineus]|uniref:Uncharacterized protein n=1 Tax=Hymenoscyphus fraxineus TaxID=746836 RepID=A0A9N9PS83_9HELO|nr:hypothetical protein HYFRA_00003305 [Hymenoscyphus fraxineus]
MDFNTSTEKWVGSPPSKASERSCAIDVTWICIIYYIALLRNMSIYRAVIEVLLRSYNKSFSIDMNGTEIDISFSPG